MLLRDCVAFGACQRGVRRDGLFVGDASMTGAAIFRRMRQQGIMRIMAADAHCAGIVKRGDYLRETGWTRRIITVAERTESPFARGAWQIFIRRVDVFCRRPMTDFAGEALMIGIHLHLKDLGMALKTGLMACIIDGLSNYFIHGICAIMPILAKRTRDQDHSHRHKCDN